VVRANKFSAFGLAVSLLLLGVRVSKVKGSIFIDTTVGWNFADAALPVGDSGTETYGQTFKVTGPETVLDSFSFWMKPVLAPGNPPVYLAPIAFAAYVMSWDTSAKKATGSILYQSGTTTVGPETALKKLTFDTGGLTLTDGVVYIAFMSTSAISDGFLSDEGWVGYRESDVYSDGGFYYFNSGKDFSSLTTYGWENSYSQGGTHDLAFQASFSDPSNAAVPEPSSLVIFGVGAICLSLAGWPRRRRKNV